ncbi:ABC transporter permease subunit [Pengzhenrongella sp.]|jgi:multiple sugar transport system permease protein|uniref:ABC transporter permease n=1 Tax=Pengzhenrongella sp. TaxID=2888820 RepID=UPI002F9388FE
MTVAPAPPAVSSTTTTPTATRRTRPTTGANPRTRYRPGARPRTIAAFLLPFFVPFVLFYLAPVLYAIGESFSKIERSAGQFGTQRTVFGGFTQYERVFASSEFWASVGRVGLFGVVQVPVMLFLSLLIALLLDSRLVRFKAFFRLAAFMPYAVPGLIAAIMWSFLYHPQLSPIVSLLGEVGIHADFLSPGSILWPIANISTWLWTGYNMIIIYSALQAIPQEIYEAARLDGASNAAIALRIKVPMVLPSIILTSVFSIHRDLAAVLGARRPRPDRAERLDDIHAEHDDLRHSERKQLPRGGSHVRRHRGRHLHPELRLHEDHEQEDRTMTATLSPEIRPATDRGRVPKKCAGSRESLAARIGAMSILVVLTIYFLIPIYFLMVSATKSQGDFSSTFGLWFANFHLIANLQTLVTAQDGIFVRWAGNSLIYAGGGALIGTFLSALAGYALAKFRFRGRDFLFSVVLGGVLVPSAALALPLFLMFSAVNQVNTYWAVILPSVVNPFGVFLARIFTTAAVPDEILESARLDGRGSSASSRRSRCGCWRRAW